MEQHDEITFKGYISGALHAARFSADREGERVPETRSIVLVDLMQAVFILLRVYNIDAPNNPHNVHRAIEMLSDNLDLEAKVEFGDTLWKRDENERLPASTMTMIEHYLELSDHEHNPHRDRRSAELLSQWAEPIRPADSTTVVETGRKRFLRAIGELLGAPIDRFSDR